MNMKNIVIKILVFCFSMINMLIYSQNKLPTNSDGKDKVSSVIFDRNEYQIITPVYKSESNTITSSFNSSAPNSVQEWVNITTENFEGSVPGSGWDIYAQSGYADAYWGKLLLSDNVHYAGWCAASGTQASTWGHGYLDIMRSWMIYGPFDLTNTTDATLEFLYFNDCEPTYDSFGWYASLNGTNYYGYFLSDTSSNYQFQSKVFDLKSVPTIGNLTGKSGVYIAFLFNSDSTISDFEGAIIDEIVLKKFVSSSYPSSISINTSFSFTNITQSSSYRMVGLPGDLNLPLSQLISGTRKTDWNAYHDNGAASNYLVEYDGSANFNFTPGHGFWLLSKNAVNVNIVVNSVSLAGNQTYSIPLRTGWNIISNPFERSSNWSAVQTANGLGTNVLLYDWVGSWNNSATFVPYKGYYFNNITGLTSLIIPYDPGGTLGKTSAENELKISSENDISFSLFAGNQEKSKIFIGFNSESTIDFDKADYFAPPGDFEEARIVIHCSELSTDYKYLMKESRSEIGGGQIYELEVKNVTGQDLVFKIKGLDNYEGYLAYLIDKRLNNEIKLSNDSEIIIPANVTNNNYGLIIGTQQFIDEKKGNVIPTEFALFQNYPNPFNPTTVIRYSIPTAVLVNIKIYDLLGNEMLTLLNEFRAPGNYENNFDGVQFASGVYIYKLQAGNYTESKKMLLLR
jgi:hypothetical protein